MLTPLAFTHMDMHMAYPHPHPHHISSLCMLAPSVGSGAFACTGHCAQLTSHVGQSAKHTAVVCSTS